MYQVSIWNRFLLFHYEFSHFRNWYVSLLETDLENPVLVV